MSFFKPYEKNYVKRPSETIYNALITDPEKRAKVLELLTQEGLVAPNENVSPNRLQQQKCKRDVANIQPSLIKQIYSPKNINKPKVRMESPSALCRRRALEALNAHSDTQNTITKPVTFDIGSLLSGIVGYCEVRSRAGDRSVGIKAMMKLMGATVLDNFTRDVTHVVFKDGTFATYQKAKLLNVHLVSVLWLEAIRRMKHRVPEAKYPARGVEDPNASIALTIQNEFDDIIADEYRESRGESPLVDTRDNHVTQRLKSQPRNGNIPDQDDEILQQISLLHSSTKRVSYNRNNLSKNNSYHSLNSNTSNDDIVPCSQDARTSLSKAHQNIYKPLEIVNTHDLIRKKYTKSHETINEFSKITRTHETFEDSSEISLKHTSRIAKHAKDSFELPKAQSIRSPESLESHRFALQEACEEITKNSDDMLRLHITTSEESNNATKSSANSTRRMFENDLVRNSLNNQWLRKTISPGSSTHLEPVAKTKKRHTMKLVSNQDEINDYNNFIIPRAPISNNITVDDSLNSTTSNRATRYSNQLVSEDDSISTDLKSVDQNRRQSIAKQNSNEFIQEIGTILSQSKINKRLSKPCSFLGDSSSSEEEDIVEQQNTSKKAPKTRRNSENYINIRSSAEEDQIFDQQNNSNSTKRKSIISQVDKKSTKKSTTEVPLNQQHDLDELKTPNNKKSTTKLNSSKRVESITKNNTAQAKLKTPRRKSSTGKKSSSEDDEQVIDLINSAKTIQKTPINSNSVKRDKLGLVTGRNSENQNNKRNHRKTNNVNSEDNENLDQEFLKNNKLNKSQETKNETGSENMRIKSKNETLKSASEINIIKPISDFNASQSTLNLVSINENDKNRKEPNKLRRRKLYSADDSISEELFNRGATEFTVPSINATSRKVKHQVKMLQDFEIPKTLSKKARAILSTQKRAATIEKTKASTSTENNKVQTKPLNFTNLKSGSSSDSPTKKSKSTTRNPALATPSTRKSMRISKRMQERSVKSTCSSDTDDTRINSTNSKRQSINSDDSESTRNVSPRKKSCNARVLHFNSSSEIELQPSTVRRSTRKLIKQVDNKSKKTLKTQSQRKIVSPKKSSPDEVIDRRSTLEFQHKTSRESLQRIRLTQKPKVVLKLNSIVCTRLHKADVEVFQEIVKQLGNFVVEDEVTDRTTHLVAGSPARTINILRAVARGCWILRHEWLYKSLEAGKWLEEEEYELTEFSPVVQASRRQKQAFGPLFSMDVFKGIGEIYICRSSTPRFSDLEELVTLCGGDIVSLQRKAKICVGDFVRSETTTCVNEKWILDSITQNKKKALKNYLIIGSPVK